MSIQSGGSIPPKGTSLSEQIEHTQEVIHATKSLQETNKAEIAKESAVAEKAIADLWKSTWTGRLVTFLLHLPLGNQILHFLGRLSTTFEKNVKELETREKPLRSRVTDLSQRDRQLTQIINGNMEFIEELQWKADAPKREMKNFEPIASLFDDDPIKAKEVYDALPELEIITEEMSNLGIGDYIDNLKKEHMKAPVMRFKHANRLGFAIKDENGRVQTFHQRYTNDPDLWVDKGDKIFEFIKWDRFIKGGKVADVDQETFVALGKFIQENIKP